MYPVFTLTTPLSSYSPDAQEGAEVYSHMLKGAGVEIACLKVGESGRGRNLGVIPVQGAKPGSTLFAASVADTRSGKKKLVASRDRPLDSNAAIVVARPTPGHRGGVRWSGEAYGWKGEPGGSYVFRDDPSTVLCSGFVAQGIAGGMASGEQRAILLARDVVLRLSVWSRRVAASAYYVFDGKRMLAVAGGDDRDLLPPDHPLALPRF